MIMLEACEKNLEGRVGFTLSWKPYWKNKKKRLENTTTQKFSWTIRKKQPTV